MKGLLGVFILFASLDGCGGGSGAGNKTPGSGGIEGGLAGGGSGGGGSSANAGSGGGVQADGGRGSAGSGGNNASSGQTGSGGGMDASGRSGGGDGSADVAGDESTGTTCGSFNACGGSVFGVWEEPGVQECGPTTAERLTAECPGYVRTGKIQASGTITFGDGGGFSIAILGTGTSQSVIPASCMNGVACSSGVNTYSRDAGISQTCRQDTSGNCVCTTIEDNFPYSLQASYTINGSTLTMTQSMSSLDPETVDYCVQGNTLRMRYFDSNTGKYFVNALTRL